MPITRRAVLGFLSSSTFFLTVPARAQPATTDGPEPTIALTFDQGVASGDPRSDSAMLWTRAVPKTVEAPSGDGQIRPVALLLQLSKSENFDEVFYEALLQTNESADYTVRAFVDGLQADRHYYYRFLGGEQTQSRTGRTRTAPAKGQDSDVKLAFASCQSFEQSYYGSWARMIADDKAAAVDDKIQFVLHLGDFIYERSWNKRYDGSDQARYVPPFPDGAKTEENRYAVSLADYRHVYKTYLGDPWLQEARARWPFVCTWDDHEFSNDNFQSYSHYGEEPLLEAQRKYEANQAWFEYIPAVMDEVESGPAHDFRPTTKLTQQADPNAAARDSLCIYRRLSWGKNLDVVLTDTRSYRSPPCLDKHMTSSLGLPQPSSNLIAIADAGRAHNNNQPPALLPYGDGSTPNPWQHREPGSCLGLAQRDWFLSQLEASTARWKVWGNAIPLLPLRMDLSAIPLAGYEDSPMSIDSWEGFPHEVNYLMTQIQDRQIGGVVSLSGDHHLHAAGTVQPSTGKSPLQAVIADFAVAGISSSPVYEDIKAQPAADTAAFRPLVYTELDGAEQPLWNLTMMRGVLASYAFDQTGLDSLANWLGPNNANHGLKFVDANTNGYGIATFEATQMMVSLVSIPPTLRTFSEPPEITYTAQFTLPLWQGGQTPEPQGPDFIGQPPFPFAQS
ncbi:MAG: alkaline phosphatase D [Halieaceae bacterium]|jgi:alkaline phosphatase D